MAKSLLVLARELSNRNKELMLVSPSGAGSTTSLVSTSLNQFLPASIAQFYVHVYGTATGAGAVDGANQGIERDASGWTSSTSTIALPAPGLPSAPSLTSGVWEIRRLNDRGRTVEALNSGIGQLGLACLREFKDESLVGINNTYRYTIPSSQSWARVDGIEVQTNLTVADYPYTPAEQYGLKWRPERTVSTAGVELWQIQFNSQPPPGYILRVWGEGYYPDLLLETDTLAIAGRWERIVLEWIYEWAQGKLAEWNWDAFATGDARKEHERKLEHLQEAKSSILEQMKVDHPGRVVTPMSSISGRPDDPGFIGAFNSAAIRNSPFRPF